MRDEVEGNQDGTRSDSSDARLSRRRMLQAAVAGGVGVAAWSTPSIRSIGGTPAYAVACSAQATTYRETKKGGNTNCGQACASQSSLGWLGAGNNSRNITVAGLSGDLVFLDPVPECSETARRVDIVVTRDSDGAALDCILTGVYIEAINNTKPVPAVPLGYAPQIQTGADAPPELCDISPYVDCTDTVLGPKWIGIENGSGTGNICSSQWLIEMQCVPLGCPTPW